MVGIIVKLEEASTFQVLGTQKQRRQLEILDESYSRIQVTLFDESNILKISKVKLG